MCSLSCFEILQDLQNGGPNLDFIQDSQNVAYVKDIVTNGLGVMPAFGKDGIYTPERLNVFQIMCKK